MSVLDNIPAGRNAKLEEKEIVPFLRKVEKLPVGWSKEDEKNEKLPAGWRGAPLGAPLPPPHSDPMTLNLLKTKGLKKRLFKHQ